MLKLRWSTKKDIKFVQWIFFSTDHTCEYNKLKGKYIYGFQLKVMC